MKIIEIINISDVERNECCEILSAICGHSHQENLEDIMETNKYSMSESVSLLDGLVKIRYYCEHLIRSLQQYFEDKLENINLSDLSRVIGAFATINYHPNDRILQFSLNKISNHDLTLLPISQVIN